MRSPANTAMVSRSPCARSLPRVALSVATAWTSAVPVQIAAAICTITGTGKAQPPTRARHFLYRLCGALWAGSTWCNQKCKGLHHARKLKRCNPFESSWQYWGASAPVNLQRGVVRTLGQHGDGPSPERLERPLRFVAVSCVVLCEKQRGRRTRWTRHAHSHRHLLMLSWSEELSRGAALHRHGISRQHRTVVIDAAPLLLLGPECSAASPAEEWVRPCTTAPRLRKMGGAWMSCGND